MIIALYLLILFVLIDSPIFTQPTTHYVLASYNTPLSMKIEITGSKKLLVGHSTMNLGTTLHRLPYVRSTPHNNRSNNSYVRIWAMAREILQQNEK